eukprot:CAMPEP_0181244568 /NCGR_PEP_ID=MMETSP1096-20121128/42935_1 /TAXON_ID=156174 ORGANISM="Chrysochromulina ericina, Strain CCMP281" /NCGR_SAMPLE_ID=MMETSP1096 /ASSEMBLY_ACC=CAM_ASM_000453 /LENGTH=56 /DNA_ID=CAMNT_0023341137 /DNA_START=376 /DNA_END=546 /DNA_ORIENTATION=-
MHVPCVLWCELIFESQGGSSEQDIWTLTSFAPLQARWSSSHIVLYNGHGNLWDAKK